MTTISADLYSQAQEAFGKKFAGKLLQPGAADYEAARKVWNGMIDRKPGLIAQCSNARDIALAVSFAAAEGIVLSVKGGGHNVAGNAVCEGGLMIDLSAMKRIEIDKAGLTAEVEPGVILREFDAATIAEGLATTGGTVSDTGIAGLTLGGGLGYLMGRFGIAADNLLGAEIVTAKGEVIWTDESRHPDLFWAIRGGGGNFGIVSKFKYRLHRFGPNLVAGMLLYPMDQAKPVMQFYREYIRKCPDEMASYAGFIVLPDGTPVTMILPAWTGAMEEAEKHMAPFRSFGQPIADMIGEMPYVQLQSILDAAAPTGIRRYWKSGYFPELTDQLIDIVLKYLATRPSPLSPVLFFHMRGKAARIDNAATAFANRADHWDSDIISQWTDPADDQKNLDWTRSFWHEIAPMTRGVYVNHLDSDDNPRVAQAYGDNFARLKAIKQTWDPGNLFRMNNNILPG